MLVPGLSCGVFLWLIRPFNVLDVRFLAFAVKVLTQQIQYSVDALVAVLLAVTLKLLRVFAQDSLEHVRAHHWIIAVPHFVKRFCVGHGKTPLRAEGVLNRELIDKREATLQEELSKFVRVGEALKATVHVARIAKICETY